MDQQITATSGGDFEVESTLDGVVQAAEPTTAEPTATADTVEAASDEPSSQARDKSGRFVSAKSDDAPAEEPTDEPAEEPVEAKPEAKPEAKKRGNPRHDPEARIRQALEQKYAAERRAAELERRLAESAQPKTEAPAKAPEWQRFRTHPDAPREQDFSDYGDYIAAMGLFVADQRINEREQASRAQVTRAQSESARREVETTFASAMDTAITEDPTFLESCSEAVLGIPTFASLQPGERPQAGHFIGEELIRAEHPAAIMRHLTAHPNLLQRLATLPPRLITREMAKLDLQVGAAPTGTAQTRTSSTAKPPVRPVTGAPVALDSPPDDDADFMAHKRYYDAMDWKRRTGR